MEETKNAMFSQRLIAFLIDMFLVAFCASLIAGPFIDTKSINKLNDESVEIMDNYLDKKIDTDTYLVESASIIYQIDKKNGTLFFVTIFLELLYFVVFQMYNKGQTFGKKIMKIKVVSTNSEELSYNQVLLRSLIINCILFNFIHFALVLFAGKDTYIYALSFFQVINYLVILVSGFRIIFDNKNRRGLHDLIAHTKVVSVN